MRRDKRTRTEREREGRRREKVIPLEYLNSGEAPEITELKVPPAASTHHYSHTHTHTQPIQGTKFIIRNHSSNMNTDSNVWNNS